MKIRRFEVAGLAQFGYVISSQGCAVVIDAMRDFEVYTTYAAQMGLAITHVIETHIHADFASASMALAAATGAELALSAYDEGELYQYAMEHRRLKDGDAIEVGSLRLEALHTPGHTPEHLSFALIDTERNDAEPVALFSGDFLFVGSLGRPDLLGDDAKVALAHELYRSLHERIAALPDSAQIYPGHGAGSLCGAGMSERPDSTLGYERTSQPFFTLEEDEFVSRILQSVPPMPAYYPRMKKLNAAGAASVATLPGGTKIEAAQLHDLLAKGDVTVLDLRRPEAFGGAHIKRAIHIGAGQNLSLWAGWLLDAEKAMVLVNDTGDDEQARRALVRVGIDRIVGYLAQGMPGWIDAGYDCVGTPQLSVGQTNRLSADALVLDVRQESEWMSGHIPGARHIMLGDLAERCGELPRDRPVVTVCGSGYRSSIAASLLQRDGFRHVRSMSGGMIAWERQKLPTSM